MKLWILRPVKGLPEDDNPWRGKYDASLGFVIRAKDEHLARAIAHKHGQDENRTPYHDLKPPIDQPWLNDKYSTCEVLVSPGDSGLIIRASRNG